MSKIAIDQTIFLLIVNYTVYRYRFSRSLKDEYKSNKNIALSHVKFGLTPHYHIDIDWRQNVKYEHKLNGKVYNYTPEQEINYLYRKRWQEPYYKKDASLEYMMQCLVKEEVYEPVAMYFRNSRIQEFEECPDGVLMFITGGIAAKG